MAGYGVGSDCDINRTLNVRMYVPCIHIQCVYFKSLQCHVIVRQDGRLQAGNFFIYAAIVDDT